LERLGTDAAMLKLLHEGLSTSCTRHNATLQLAIWLKGAQGMGQEAVRKLLQQWARSPQVTRCSQSSLAEIEKDTDKIVDSVFAGDYPLRLRQRQVRLTMGDLEWVASVGQTLNEQRLLFAFLVHGLIRADPRGIFYISRAEMGVSDHWEGFAIAGLYLRDSPSSPSSSVLPRIITGPAAFLAHRTRDSV
jgi:hypothetical protein